MRILFISGELIGSAIAHRLVKEGHDLKLYIHHVDRKGCFEGFVEKTKDWKQELSWVGKEGLIVFDDVIFEGAQKKLRSEGYSVIGGDLESDKLELDRQYFHDVLKEHGIDVLPSYEFNTADEAIEFVKNNKGVWVVKQNSHIGMLNYIGEKEDGLDILDILEQYKVKHIAPINLQKRVYGIEIGVGRYFNGSDWVGPIEINLEHKRLCNGDIGPLTAEMGTVMWYEKNEDMRLYAKTLSKIRNYLQKIEYKGDIAINCIVDEKHVWPLEATMRFGTPATEIHAELHISPWGEFMKAVADGKDYPLKYHEGYGIAVSIAVPPFPFAPETFENSNIQTSTGTSIYFKEQLTAKEMRQIHFEEVSVNRNVHGSNKYYIAGKHGYALYVTGHGKTVTEAQKSTYDLIGKIILPKMFYRTDIGDKFVQEDYKKLKDWGWIV